MSTRNKLLELIVLALGGTVTNPNNRNQLLYDWLTALGGPVPPTRLAPNFNGVAQLAEYPGKLIDIDNLDGFVLEGYFEPGDGTLYSQNTSATSSIREFQIYEGGGDVALILGGQTTTLSTGAATPVTSGVYRFEFGLTQVSFYFNSNLINTVTYNVGASREGDALFRVCARGNNSTASYGYFKSGLSYNHKINDGSVYNFPMDDGWSNNPTMRNTGSGADGAFINMTEASWVEVNE